MTKNVQKGSVIWITGLSGAGKTTISKVVAKNLMETNSKLILLDGDSLRDVLGKNDLKLGHFERNNRIELALSYSKLSRILALQGFIVIVATISLFKEIHTWNAANLPNYFEVFLSVPVEELRNRDPKGLYKDYESGYIKNLAGFDLDYDVPASPNLVVDFQMGFDIEQIAELIQTKYNDFII